LSLNSPIIASSARFASGAHSSVTETRSMLGEIAAQSFASNSVTKKEHEERLEVFAYHDVYT
jgi:hypothetical protein